MRPARILLLLVAILAGGLAAFLATRGDAPSPQQAITEFIQEPRGQVLVASEAIGVGQRLSASVLQWQDWPTGAIRPEFITTEMLPDGPESLTDAVARFEFFPGEPIREAKLVRTDQGYLSAVIPAGMRAVSISVTADSASGGFIIPNDHVDVVLTRADADGQISETILANVKVLAINSRIGEVGTTGAADNPDDPSSQVFANAIATLVLNPAQSEAVINAAAVGELSLVLRSITDFAAAPEQMEERTNNTVRIIRFGVENNVRTATTTPAAAIATPVQTIEVGPALVSTPPAPVPAEPIE